MYDDYENEEYYERKTKKAEAAFDAFVELACIVGLALAFYYIVKHYLN